MRLKKFADFTNEARYEPDYELDRILDKISELGIDSITPQERAYLDGERSEEEAEYDGTYSEEDSDIMDEEGNYKKPEKSNYLLLVHGVDTKEFHSSELTVTAMDKTGKYIIDTHFVDLLFPELEGIGLEDVAEGHMEYYGELETADELVEKLKSMGFNVKIGEGPITGLSY